MTNVFVGADLMLEPQESELDWRRHRDEIVESLRPAQVDALERRLALLVSLRPGWDGNGSEAPARAAVQALYAAVSRLTSEYRASLGASAHPDGYIAVTRRLPDRTLFADLWPDHIEYEAAGSEWRGPIDSDALSVFLADA